MAEPLCNDDLRAKFGFSQLFIFPRQENFLPAEILFVDIATFVIIYGGILDFVHGKVENVLSFF